MLIDKYKKALRVFFGDDMADDIISKTVEEPDPEPDAITLLRAVIKIHELCRKHPDCCGYNCMFYDRMLQECNIGHGIPQFWETEKIENYLKELKENEN